MNSPAPSRYSAPAQILHWLTAILVLVAFIYGPGGREARIYSAARDSDRQLHETLGVCVLALSVVRLLWLEAHPLTLLWGIAVAPPIAESHALGATISELHGWLGDAILWIAGLHAAAALFHQYVLKDGVLASMLPARNAKR